MATEFNFNQDEEDELGSSQPMSSDPAQAQSTSDVGGASGGATAATPAGARPTTPGGRPNIRQYLDANQGAGQKLAQGIQDKTKVKAGEIEQGVNEGRSQLQSATNPLESKLGEEGDKVIKTAFKDPSQILQQQDQLSEFQRLRDKGYESDINAAGTAAQQATQNLSAQANKLQGTADLAGSEGGRFELLRNTYGQPQYTRGQQKLDQLFLQAEPGSAKQLQQGLQGISQQQQQNVSGLSSEAQAKIQALQGLSGQRAQDWQNLYTGGSDANKLDTDLSSMGVSDINAASQRNLANAQSDVDYAAGLRQRLGSNQLTQEDAQKLGLGDLAGKSLYDVNLGSYINQNDKQATLANTADQDQVARYRALQQLSGDISGDIFGGATDIGGFKAYDFNKDKLSGDMGAKRTQYEVSNIDNQINQMRNAGYFGGASSGGGMRYNDTGAGMRAATGQQLSALQQQMASGQITPEQYYAAATGAINQVWSPWGGLGAIAKDGNMYQQLQNYGGQLGSLRANTLNTNAAAPAPSSAPQVDWDEVARNLAQGKK